MLNHSRRRPVRLMSLLFPTLLALLGSHLGCTHLDEGSTRVSVTRVDSSGIEMVRNGDLAGQSLIAQEVRRIGALHGDEPYLFSQVYDLAVDADGTLYVGNNQTGTIRVFSPDGRYLREFGGHGEGPGEFTMVNQVWLAGDWLVVTDWQRGGKTVVFTKDGEVVASWRSVQPNMARIMPQAYGPQGWVGWYDPPYRRPEVEPGELWEEERHFFRLFPKEDSVGVVLYRMPPRRLFGSPETEGLDWPLFEPRPVGKFDAQGNFYLSRGGEYRVETYTPEGTLARVVTKDFRPVPINDSDVENLIDLQREYLESPEGERYGGLRHLDRFAARVETQASFPGVSHRAPLGRFLVALDGSFWVERNDRLPPAEVELELVYRPFRGSFTQPTTWDLFDTSGVFVGSVELPPRFHPMDVTATTITGVQRDNLDVEYVVTFAARRSGEG